MSPSSSQSPPTTKDPPDKASNPTSSPRPPPATPLTVTNPIPQPYTEPTPAGTNPPLTRPPFTPFFTLINDTATSTTHHPTNIHYLFSDDDPELLTSACLDCLDPQISPKRSSPSASTSISSSTQHAQSTSSSGLSTSRSKGAPQQQHPRTTRERRVLLLDLDDTGSNITSAHSLSSSWQILSASLGPAPTWGDESPSTAEKDAPSLMLRIEGTDGRDAAAPAARASTGGGSTAGKQDVSSAAAAVGESEFQALMEDFDRRMAMLRTVVEAGNMRVEKEIGGEEEQQVDDKDQEQELHEEGS